MHVLRLRDVKDALEHDLALARTVKDWRAISVIASILTAFDDDWVDADPFEKSREKDLARSIWRYYQPMRRSLPNEPMLLTALVHVFASRKDRCPAAADSLPLVVAAAQCKLKRPAQQQIGEMLGRRR